MANIRELLNNIKYAIFGKDVRQAIHDAIEECYNTASIDHDNANMEVKLARGEYRTLNERFNFAEEKTENNTYQLKQINEGKIDKNGSGQVTWANIAQDARENISGNKVAVVGKNAVLSENIADGEVYGEKTNFLEQLNKNLFKGKFLNYYLNGSDVGMKLTKETGKIVAIDIKPNTKYSINKESTGIEGTNYYFKIATYTKSVEDVLKLLESGEVTADGGVIKTLTSTINEHLNYIFTSGSSDKSVFILVGKEKTPYTEVMEGEITGLLYEDYEGIYETKDNLFFKGENIKDKSTPIEKMNYMESVNKNLFDGNFVNFYVSGKNSSGLMVLVKSDQYKTFIVDVEPNTEYTLLKDSIEKEDNYYYTKVASFVIPKEQLLKTDNYAQDGAIGLSYTSSDVTRLTFTTGPNDKSVAITVSKSQIPYVELLKGNYNSYQDNGYDKKYYSPSLDYYRKGEIDRKFGGYGLNSFVKIGDKMTIKMGNSAYIFERSISSSKGLDTYRLTQGTHNDVLIWEGSDIEAPILEKGASDFVGGVHGYEQYLGMDILIDGKKIDNSQDIDIVFNNLTIFVKSHLYRHGTTTPVFTRYKKLEFKDNELIVSNNMICMVEDFIVARYTGSGLYSVYKSIVNGYTLNTLNRLITEGGQTKNTEIKEGHFYCKGFTINVKALSGMGEYYNGSVADFSSESRPRYKFYFDSINASVSGVPLKLNEELNASFSIKIK